MAISPATPAATPPDNVPAPAKPAVIPAVGQPVWYYADHNRTKGMKSYDWDAPFAAFVAYVPSDRLVNLLVIDHNGTFFGVSSVAVFQGDDGDDKSALSYCELEAPKPKEVVAISGIEGQPIPLLLGPKVAADAKLGNIVTSVRVSFTVPAGDTYLFISGNAAIREAYIAYGMRQGLMLTTAQIAAGALNDLSITIADASEPPANGAAVLLTVSVTEQNVSGVTGKTYRFDEAVTVAPAPEPIAPGASATGANNIFIGDPVIPLGSAATLGSIVGGSGYVSGTYPNVPLTGGSGNGGVANIVVTNGVVTAATMTAGSGYEVGDLLSASNTSLGGTGTGFSVPVASVSASASGVQPSVTTAPFVGGPPPRAPAPATPMQSAP